ncbi:coenzyme A pyrophosphatase [Flavobacterium palustre]|uniref:Coenzyme A pyrophosphatase n=1 Tax=Flavobacterium palustre TaxID=1476463 RepID=A0ABQ1HT55_9FLAO|nr:CoA pyrophosphatase [Flavobacterium palustre]GGA86657.1 coenzyme A pyrophosphatase [Flavobacterium palustre]
MDFQYFLNFIPDLVQMQLPAAISHEKMMPFERKELLKKINLKERNPKEAAVLMLLYPKNGQTHLVLIVRNSYPGVHSDQIAFPGGKFESKDADFQTTALRETEEEIGISPDKIEILKAFSSLYIPPSNFMVYPFLGICKEEIQFVPDPAEVAGIIELSLVTFRDDSIVAVENLSTSYAVNIEVPAFKIDGHIVWGATAMMLSELRDVLNAVLIRES